jgi:hypothetical protein
MTGFQEIDLHKIKKADWNYKTDDPEMMANLIENIRRIGQVENLLVREIGDGFEAVNGNHRVDALNTLKTEKVFVYNFGEITLQEAKRIAVETNETRFGHDPERLAFIIEELSIDFGLENIQVTMPYSMAEMETMVSIDAPIARLPEPGETKMLHRCPKCEHEWTI